MELQPATDWNNERIELDEEDRDRLLRMCQQKVHPESVQICHQKPNEEYPMARKQICYSLFETNRCPDPWIEDLNRMDKVWVFSEFNRKHWAASFIQRQLDGSKIEVIPFGIDTDVFSPDVEPAQVQNKKGFTFLTVGDFTERKNFEGLIEAFVKEFSAADDVCLIVKAHYKGFVRRHHDNVIEKLKDIVGMFNEGTAPRILFFGNKIAAADMPRLYRAGDCFVLASRGEGLGIPIIEAMSCGLPIIASEWGAQSDYLTDENSRLIRCDVRQIDDINYISKCPAALNHSWAYPDMEHLREHMRFMYENHEEAKKLGVKAREDMKLRTWQKAGLAMVKKLGAL